MKAFLAATFLIFPSPVPIPLYTWAFEPEAGTHHLRVTANGKDYGRVAVGTKFVDGQSIIVQDTIFVGGFQ